MFLFSKITDKKRTVLMGTLIMLTVVGYNIMRGMKKAVVLTFPSAGAAYIPFIKTTLVMPMSIIIGAFYLYLRHRKGIINAYYVITSSFLAYFVIFTFYLLPNIQSITPDPAWIQAYQTNYPHFKFLIGMIANWPIAIYYVAAELWGTYSLVILFWQVANELFTPKEATENYPIFIFVSSISIIIASYVLEALSHTSNPLITCTNTICALGICMMSIICILASAYNLNSRSPARAEKNKKKIPLADSFALTLRSPHVLYIGICVFSFGMLVNFFELSLDHKAALYYPDPRQLLEFQGWFTRTKGLLCIIANVGSAILLRRAGWFAVAMITPCICILSANLVLVSCYHIDFLHSISQGINAEDLLMWAGFSLLIITYACKYSFFDTTKELSFTPLPDSIKANAKAVADGICGRAGKSGSSFVQASLISITAAEAVTDIIPYLIYLGTVLSIFWVWAMIRLNRSYREKMQSIEIKTRTTTTEDAISETPSELEASTT